MRSAEPQMRDVQEAARVKGVELHILKAGTENEINAAFPTLVQLQAGALMVGADPFFTRRREQLVALAARDAFRRSMSVKVFERMAGVTIGGGDD